MIIDCSKTIEHLDCIGIMKGWHTLATYLPEIESIDVITTLFKYELSHKCRWPLINRLIARATRIATVQIKEEYMTYAAQENKAIDLGETDRDVPMQED